MYTYIIPNENTIDHFSVIFASKSDYDLGPIEFYLSHYFANKYNITLKMNEVFQKYVKIIHRRKISQLTTLHLYKFEDIEIKVFEEMRNKGIYMEFICTNTCINDNNSIINRYIHSIKKDMLDYESYVKNYSYQ